MKQFPPKNFIPTESAIDGIDVFMPAPEEEDLRPTVDFDCPQCGAITAYSAADNGLTCTHCGYYEPPARKIVGKQAQEFAFTVETLQQAAGHRQAHGWGQIRKELQCQNCAVYTSVPVESMTHTCPFCGSRKVIHRQATQDLLRPRFLIPFQLEADACGQIVRKWLGASWMTPKTLKDMAQVGEFSGVFLPFWTFDARNRASWRAEVGRRKEGEKNIKWKWESGNVERHVDDLLIAGTAHVSKRLLDSVQTFDLAQLVPYEPQYLAGFQAQNYDIDLDKAWQESRHQMREDTRKFCIDAIDAKKVRNFSMELDFDDESWRYILLPVFLASYQYGNKTWQVMINAQTGDIEGQRPVSWLKVWLAVLAVLAPGAIIGLVGVLTISTENGWIALVAGLIFLFIGLVTAMIVLVDASQMDDV